MHTENMNELTQDEKEKKIREFLKTLTVTDIANSVYLYGIDFDTCEIDEVVNSIFSLFCEVKTLEKMIKNNFQSEDGEKVLRPSTPQSQTVVIQDYNRKCNALLKVLECAGIAELLRERIVSCVLDSVEENHEKSASM